MADWDLGRHFSASRLIVAGVIILILAVSVALYAYGKETSLLLFSSWLQGVGTVAAAAVGYAAYRNWTKQEILKAKAADARRLLQQSHVVTKRLRALRSLRGTYSYPIKLRSIKEAMNPQRQQLARESSVAAATLNDSIEMAQELFDHGLAQHLMQLLKLEQNISSAVSYMESLALDREEDVMQDDGWQNEAETELRLLGFRPIAISGSPRSTKSVPPDQTDHELTAVMKSISDNLRRHINYGEQS